MTTPTEKRAADRTRMADMLATAMREAGATVTVAPCRYEPRRIDVRITAPGGAYVTVDFDGTSTQPDVHVATWNTPAGVFLDPAFGDVNPCHYGKATRVGYGIEHLIDLLQADVDDCVAGTAYLSHDSAQLVAMAERYARNGWSDPRRSAAA